MSNEKRDKSPVKTITFTVLVVSALFFTWYVLSDRHVPYTDQARINGLMVPVVPGVSGNITGINVSLHEKVIAGDTLFQIDKRPFELVVQIAEANVDNTAQSVASKTASVKSAAGRLGMARAQLDRAQRDWSRVQKVMTENPGALSQADRDQSETALSQATEQVASAEADLERAEQSLGVSGDQNPQFRAAVKSLEQAQLNLAYTGIIASTDGYMESFSIDLGYYAAAGQPIATQVSDHGKWIQADMKENNLTLMKPGDPVEFLLDVLPGRIFRGKIKSIGLGVSTGNTNRGDLPNVGSSSAWLRDPQRFPVIIAFEEPSINEQLRLGGQVDVVVFTGTGGGLLKALGKLRIRINSWLSYVR
jgi:multidrug resistance efflux pump